MHTTEIHTTAEVSCNFTNQSDSPRAARQFVRTTLAEWGAASLAEDAALVVSELATNAIVHAGTGFTVALTDGREWIRLAVTDDSTILPDRPDTPATGASRSAPSYGRGLSMIEAIATRWGFDHSSEGKVVWAEFGR